MRSFFKLFKLPTQESTIWLQLVELTLKHLLALLISVITLAVLYFIIVFVTNPDLWSGVKGSGDMHGFGWGLIFFGISLYLVLPFFIINYIIQFGRSLKRDRKIKNR